MIIHIYIGYAIGRWLFQEKPTPHPGIHSTDAYTRELEWILLGRS
jgi:hypothetical protein